MMTEHLRRVLASLDQLGPDEQDALAATIEAKLAEFEDEATWKKLFADPRSEDVLLALAEEADAEDAAGGSRDLDELLA